MNWFRFVPFLTFASVSFLSGCQERRALFSESVYDTVGKEMAKIKNHRSLEAAILYTDSMAKKSPEDSLAIRLARQDFLRDLMAYRKNYATSLQYADSVIGGLEREAARNSAREKLLVTMYRRKAGLLVNLHDFDNAVAFFERSLQTAAPLSDSCFVRRNRININMEFASIRLKTKRFREAAWFYRAALNAFSSCESSQSADYERQTLLSNMGVCYFEAGDPDSALVAYRMALKQIDKYENKYPAARKGIDIARGVALGNMADVFLGRSQLDTAARLYQRSIALCQKGIPENALFSRIRLAETYTKQRKFGPAGLLVAELEKSLDTLASESGRKRFYRVAGAFYGALGQPDKAYPYLRKYLTILENEAETVASRTESDLIQALRLAMTEGKVALLEQESNIKTLYLLLSIGGGVAAVIIATLVIRYSRRLKFQNEKIISVNRQLEVTLSGLHESNRRYSRMVEVIAHDLKNPLKVIDHLCSSAYLDAHPGEIGEVLDSISTTSRESATIIDNILAYERDVRVIDRKPTDLLSILTPSIRLMQKEADRKNQRILLIGSETAWPVINGDSIWRVMLNLLSNAIKFSYHNTEIHVTVISHDSEVIVKIEDHGIGIPPDRLDDIFDFHTTLSRPGTDGEDSSGMGLSICQRIIELHGGEIWVESEPGTGTTFFFSLPLA